jgi:hypothetical protein
VGCGGHYRAVSTDCYGVRADRAEVAMTGRLERLAKYGDFIVYRRCWDEPGMRRFIVIRDSDGRILEEFRQQRRAKRWASEQSVGLRD